MEERGKGGVIDRRLDSLDLFFWLRGLLKLLVMFLWAEDSSPDDRRSLDCLDGDERDEAPSLP